MLSVTLLQFPTSILVKNETTTTGIPLRFTAKGKPEKRSDFWVVYVNKDGQEYHLGFEVKKIGDGLRVDLHCECDLSQGDGLKKLREFTIHLDEESPSYIFQELG